MPIRATFISLNKDTDMSKAVETLHYVGESVKIVDRGTGRIGGYLVRFTGPSDLDLTGEFFTSETEFGPNKTPALVYHHGMDGTLKSRILGAAEIKIDDVGVWVEAQLGLRDDYEKMLLEMVEAGKVGWSSGAVGHLVERESMGKGTWIKTWIIGEASITPTPAEPRNTAMPLKSLLGAQEPAGSTLYTSGSTFTGADYSSSTTNEWSTTFTYIPQTKSREDDAEDEAAGAVPDAESQSTPQKAMSDTNERVDEPTVTLDDVKAVVENALKAHSEANAKTVEPEFKAAPAVVSDASHWKYDNYSPADIAFAAEFLNDASAQHLKSKGEKARPISDAAIKALAMRLDGKDGQMPEYVHAASGVKSVLAKAGIKANEIMQSTLSSYGDEWIGVAYSSNLWEKVRDETRILSQLPSFEFPAGAESLVLPLESTDPVWYNVAQAASLSANPGGIPTNTVTASQMGTSNKTMTLKKLGARVLYTGELEEDSFLPFAPQLRAQLGVSAAEYLESVLIDGDTATGATVNVNDIAGTPGGTEHFLLFDGFRKLALVTNSANARDAGVLDVEDFLKTAQLMGAAGKVGRDRRNVFFVIDGSTHDKALQLPEVKTQDVFSRPTIEGGMLTNIWGYPVYTSGSICFVDPNGANLSNTAGKVDVDTAGNNTKGSIVAVRRDHWRFGYRRRMTVEAQRVAAADSTEIVALMRFSFGYRDNEASAVSYNITV